MKTRSALVRGVLVAALTAIALATTACSGSKADSADLTSPLLRAGTTANSLAGTVSGLSGACPAVSFKLEQRSVRTDANTVFADITCALLKELARVEVSGTVQADGVILATRVHLLPPVASPPAPPGSPPSTPSYVSAVGVVSGLSGACPTIAFKIEQRIIKTDANTVFGDSKCADVRNDLRVELTGVVQSDGSILAVKLHPTTSNPPTLPPPTPPGSPAPVGIAGNVSALGGTCPALTFTLEQRTIRTDANTVFGDSKCTDVKNELRVEIGGVVQADGTILAYKLRIVPPATTPPPSPPAPPPPFPGLAGTVSAITGTCPSLIMTVEARKAITNTSTIFEGKACAELQVGMGVEIVGAPSTTSNDAIVAAKVIWRK